MVDRGKERILNAASLIGEAALLGMLYEAAVHPSPGLVSPISNGAHRDMDYFLFLTSTASLNPYLYEFARIGLEDEGDILNTLRRVGKTAENKMFMATGNVNTQKGLLFLIGVVSAAAGQCVHYAEEVNRHTISRHCCRICSGIVERELVKSPTKACTAGEKLYHHCGVTGIRGEAQAGLPSVLKNGLPYYEEALAGGMSIREALCHGLVGLMAVVEDTTVFNRCGAQGIERMQRCADVFFRRGGMKKVSGKKYLRFMDSYFCRNNISPGGAADLLAITVMIHKLEESFRD